jgi:hypothetical protein
MFLSCLLFKNSTDQYNNTIRENYDGNDKDKDTSRCIACIVLATVILIIEVALLYFALDIAVNTTQSGAERFVHVVLAVVLTLPYLLFSVLLSTKAQNVLRGNLNSVAFSFKKACGMGGDKKMSCGMGGDKKMSCGMGGDKKMSCGMSPKMSFGGHKRRGSKRSGRS